MAAPVRWVSFFDFVGKRNRDTLLNILISLIVSNRSFYREKLKELKKSEIDIDFLYGLLPSDYKNISWHESIIDNTSVVSLSGKVFALSHLAEFNKNR